MNSAFIGKLGTRKSAKPGDLQQGDRILPLAKGGFSGKLKVV
jgi:hypothetical protein